MPRKGGFGCFGSRSDHPEIRYGISDGSGVQVLREFSLPMPEESELNIKFAELVEELDLTAVHKKAMFELPPEKKWQLFLSKKKEQQEHSSTSYPEYYIDQLNALNNQKLYFSKSNEESERASLLDGLKTALRTQPLRFVHRFVELDGLACLLGLLESMDFQTCQSKIHTAVIGCFKALMNSSHGRAHVLAHPSCINIIAQSLMTENVKTKIQVLEILGAVCLVPGGHKKALDAMTHFQRFAEERTRFQILLNDLDRSTGIYSEEFNLKIAIMSFINAALKYGAGAEYLEFRVHLRFEFLMLGIQPVIEKLRTMENATLTRHLNFFDMVRTEDEKELARRYGMPFIDFRSASGMLELLKRKVGHTSSYPHLLSILHHLLLLPNEHSVARHMWQLIDRAIQQVVLQQEDGGDPDVAPMEINVNYIIDTLIQENEGGVEDLKGKLSKKERELESKKEEMDELKEALDKMVVKLERNNQELQEAMQRIREQDQKLSDADSKYDIEIRERQRLEEVIKSVGGSIPDDMKISKLTNALKPSPMSGTAPPPPPPPPPPPGGAAPPPPPPPGPPGGGFAPPPPPAPNQPSSQGGGGGGFFGFSRQPNRKAPKPSHPLKSFNWSKLPDSKIKGTVWTDIDDSEVYTVMDFADFDRMFSAYQRNEKDAKDLTDNKPKELSLIDNRRAQNCGILLSKLKMTDEEITRAILSMDEKDELSKDMVEQLLKYVPTPAEKNLLNEHNKNQHQFARADKFLYDMSRIVHYEQRLKSLCYKKRFAERMGDVKPKVKAVTSACKELHRSKRLRVLLEVVLAFGNYMNRGARGNAAGFKLSSLNNIIDTKSSANSKITLLNYLVSVLEKSYPDVLQLENDLPHVRTAAKANLNDLESEITSIKKELKDLEKELEFQNRKKEKTAGDKFIESMGSFVKVAQFSCSELSEAWDELKQKYQKIVKLFGEDPKSMQSDAFFGIFTTFLVSFAEAKNQNEEIKKKREAEERKAKAMAEQKEKDRQKSATRKLMTGSDKSKDKKKASGTGDNRGEFDDLISALRTGDVFGDEMSKMKGRRRTAGPKSTRKNDTKNERERLN